MKLFIAMVAIFLGYAVHGSHEFYVTITEINVKSDTLQISIKVFTHDLEEVIKDETGSAFFFDDSSSQEKALMVIKEYAEKHLSVGNEDKRFELTWVGHEYDADVTWIYAYATMDKPSTSLLVQNTLLTNDKRDQHNMIHVTNNGKTNSKICTAHQPEARFILR